MANTIPIRINPGTKKKLDQVLLEKALQQQDRKYTYAKLIDDLLESYYSLQSKHG